MLKETFYKMNTPLSIALIADTHNHSADDVIRSLKRNKVDIICIAGDFVYAPLPEDGLKMEESIYAMELLEECARLAPCFVSIGNHEWMLCERDLAIIRSTGVYLLDNSYLSYPSQEGTILIGGLSSASYSAYRAYCADIPEGSVDPDTIYPLLQTRRDVVKDSEPDVGWLDGFSREFGYKILLCHHPEYYPRYLKDKNIDLVLSGHAHGGQIRIKGQGLYAPGQGFLPRLTSGITDGRMVISRGLANNTIIPRLWNPEEIVYIR